MLREPQMLGFWPFFFFFVESFYIRKQLLAPSQAFFLSLPLSYLSHPIFLFCPSCACSSSHYCSRWHSVRLPFCPWHISLVHLLAPQKAARCSERARAASCPFSGSEGWAYAVTAEQRWRTGQRHPPSRSPPELWLFCQHHGKTHCSGRRGQQALGTSPVPYPWQYVSSGKVERLARSWLPGAPAHSIYRPLCWPRNIKLKKNLLLFFSTLSKLSSSYFVA